MFRFVHAWQPGDAWGAALAAEGFVGVECDGPSPEGVARVGGAAAVAGGYVVHPPVAAPAYAAIAGRALHDFAERQPGSPLHLRNGGAFTTALDLWTVLEAARHPRVKLAIDVDAARVDGQTAAVLVPTLNLRIGQLRVHEPGDLLTGYARRLAGIGFEGWIVLDPAAGTDRVAASRSMAAAFRAVLPAPPVKKAPTPKPKSAAATTP